jgi:hypothetical protein
MVSPSPAGNAVPISPLFPPLQSPSHFPIYAPLLPTIPSPFPPPSSLKNCRQSMAIARRKPPSTATIPSTGRRIREPMPLISCPFPFPLCYASSHTPPVISLQRINDSNLAQAAGAWSLSVRMLTP